MKTLFMRLKRFFKKRRAGKRRFLRTKRNITQATAEFPDIEEICRDVHTFCIFIGYPRSGHSLIGSLLDAHPNISIAHQLHALSFIEAGYGKMLLYQLILNSTRKFSDKKNQVGGGGYSYKVEGQWQGRFKKVLVIGDKRGASSSDILLANPGLLKALGDVVDVKIKIIHIIRNPFDAISTSKKRTYSLGFSKSIKTFFARCGLVARVKKEVSVDDIFDLRHEAFIEDPKMHLTRLCNFLGVEPLPDYINNCSKIVYKSPNKSRHTFKWSPSLKTKVQKRIEEFPFLDGYSFDS